MAGSQPGGNMATRRKVNPTQVKSRLYTKPVIGKPVREKPHLPSWFQLPMKRRVGILPIKRTPQRVKRR